MIVTNGLAMYFKYKKKSQGKTQFEYQISDQFHPFDNNDEITSKQNTESNHNSNKT